MEKQKLWTDKLCRACLQHSDHQMYSLASNTVHIEDNHQIHVDTFQLVDIYHQCTQLSYEQTDEQWEWICLDCHDKLVDFFKFRKMCIDSYSAFKENHLVFEEKSECNEVVLKVEVVDVADYEVADYDRNANGNDFWQNEDSDESTDRDEKCQDYGNEEDTRAKNGTLDEATTSQGMTTRKRTQKSMENKSPVKEKCRNTQSTKQQVQTTNLKDTENPGSNENEQNIVCKICSKRFFKKHRFDAHMRKHEGLKQWQCEHCDKSFEKYYTLKTHTAVKHYDESEGKPEFICDFGGCGKSYSLKDSLRVHMLQTHIGKKPNLSATKMCEQCGKSFRNNNSLLKHSYTHTRVTPHKCHICSKMFATSYKLKEHLMRHDGIKNFICPTCGLRKTTGHELRVHMRYHSTDIKYPCELCSLVFTRQANMKRHMKIVHCGIKSFPCSYCDRSFGKAETLKHHVMTHTGERPLACAICDKRFIQPIALKTHMKVHNKTK